MFLLRKARELLDGKRAAAHTVSKWSEQPTSNAGPDTAVAEFGNKLWRGFSRHASNDLDHIVRTTDADWEKVAAAWELAKFHAARAQWQRALHYLDIIRKGDRTFLRTT